MKTGFSLWELTYREFPVSLTGFGFAVLFEGKPKQGNNSGQTSRIGCSSLGNSFLVFHETLNLLWMCSGATGCKGENGANVLL